MGAPDRLSIVDELDPAGTYSALASTASSAMVDVRTRAEWAFTGLPDISATGRALYPVEWAGFPTMSPNQTFVEELMQAAGGTLPQRLFFLCRSGARSLAAARLVAAVADQQGVSIHCTNVAEGFEGDLDGAGHRGSVNGWKVAGLPWRQN